MLHMHPVGHEQPSILFARVEEVTFELELISTSKLIPKYCYNIQNAIAIYIYIRDRPRWGPGRPQVQKKKKISYNIFHLYIYIYINQGRTQVGARTPPGPKNFLFLVIIFFIFFVRPLPKLQAPFLHNKLNQPHPNSNYSTKNLTKTIKILTTVIVFQQQKKTKKKKLFYHQRTKKSYIIGEAKTKFFETTIN